MSGETPTLLGPLELTPITEPDFRTETDPVSETLCYLVFRIPDDAQSPKTQ
jgi:hypothetical protein